MSDCGNVHWAALWVTQVISWVLVIAGWFLVHYLSNERESAKERRQETRLALARLREAMEGMRDDAVAFHQGGGYAGDKLRKIELCLERLERSWLRLAPAGNNREIISKHIVAMRQSFSRSNADASTFCQQQYDSPIINGIIDAFDEAIDRLESFPV
jgi:hypothetical protein